MLEQKAKQFKALSDVTRLKIVSCLLKRNKCACEFTKLAKKDQTTVSRHLKVLTEAGIIKAEKRGRYIYFSLKDAQTKQELLAYGLKPCC